MPVSEKRMPVSENQHSCIRKAMFVLIPFKSAHKCLYPKSNCLYPKSNCLYPKSITQIRVPLFPTFVRLFGCTKSPAPERPKQTTSHDDKWCNEHGLCQGKDTCFATVWYDAFGQSPGTGRGFKSLITSAAFHASLVVGKVSVQSLYSNGDRYAACNSSKLYPLGEPAAIQPPQKWLARRLSSPASLRAASVPNFRQANVF